MTQQRKESSLSMVAAVANRNGFKGTKKSPETAAGNFVPLQSHVAAVGKRRSKSEAICHGDARRRAPCEALGERRRLGAPT